jgi:hypothetical protein
MAKDSFHDNPLGMPIPRRTLFGLVFAAGVIAPLVGTGTARADSGSDDPPGGEEEYEIPDGIGSVAWW